MKVGAFFIPCIVRVHPCNSQRFIAISQPISYIIRNKQKKVTSNKNPK